MLVNISARHCTVPDSIRRRAQDRFARMTRFQPRLEAVDVIFELDHGLHAVEARLFVAGGPTIVARATAPEFRIALDQVLARAGRQLRRQRERRTDHYAAKPQGIPASTSREA